MPAMNRVDIATVSDAIVRIRPADSQTKRAAELRQERLVKPPGSLGRLESLSVQVAGILGTARPRIRRKSLIVAAADHGVVAQDVGGYPQDVTAQMVLNFLAGGAAVNIMARMAGVDIIVVDAGVATSLPDHPGLRVIGAGHGTADITEGPAMAGSRPRYAYVQAAESQDALTLSDERLPGASGATSQALLRKGKAFGDSNRREAIVEAVDAKSVGWWASVDSNHGPPLYQSDALTG